MSGRAVRRLRARRVASGEDEARLRLRERAKVGGEARILAELVLEPVRLIVAHPREERGDVGRHIAARRRDALEAHGDGELLHRRGDALALKRRMDLLDEIERFGKRGEQRWLVGDEEAYALGMTRQQVEGDDLRRRLGLRS